MTLPLSAREQQQRLSATLDTSTRPKKIAVHADKLLPLEHQLILLEAVN